MAGAAFADVLDDLLAGSSPRAAWSAPVATHPFFWHDQGVQVFRRTPRPADVPTRSARTLTPAQQQALDVLITLGGGIDSDFTYDELRRVFRALALRYHPDRHVSRSDAERARLAILFAKAREAYELLKVVPPASMH